MSDDSRNGAPHGAANGGGDGGPSAAAQDHILSIEEVARMFGISPRLLRLYELRGLIRRKRAGRVRVYSWVDCERIALLIKARNAGLTLGAFAPVIKAMDDEAPRQTAQVGRRKCLALIHALEDQQKRIGDVLGELYRVDWELSERLGAGHHGGEARGRS
jgi:DNA-binding transcriptional MerR regulator